MAGRRRSLGVLSRAPSFTALLTARAVSLVGDGVGGLALVVHVEGTEGTGTAVALLLLAASLPRLLSPLAGTVADRFDRRLVMAGAELGQGVVMAVAALWLPPLPALLGLLVAKAALVTVAEPAAMSAVATLVPDDDLPAANALLGGVRQGGEVLGPVLGGLLVAVGGVRVGLAADALTFLATVPLLARVPRLPPEPADRPGESVLAGARTGVTYIVRNPVAGALTLSFFLVGLGAGDDVALPFLARAFDAGARGIGALYAAVGAGLILGYLVLSAGRPRLTPVSGLVVGATVAALGNVLTGLSPGIAAAVAFQVVRGAGIAAYETMLQTLLQRSVPRHLLGRVSANVYGAVNVAACLGLVVAGPLVDATSARTVLVASGATGLLAAVAGIRAGRMAP